MKLNNIYKRFITVICGILLCIFFGFSQSAYNQPNFYHKDNNSTGTQDSIMLINDSKITIKLIKRFQSKKKTKIKDKFLSTKIQYFDIDKIDRNQLLKEIYYRNFLINTHFLEFEESDFYKENFSFTIIKKSIKNYGVCYIGKYYFSNAANSSQRRATVIINIDKNEMSIWDFDDVSVIKEGLKCDFNIRGEHTIYKLIYTQ